MRHVPPYLLRTICSLNNKASSIHLSYTLLFHSSNIPLASIGFESLKPPLLFFLPKAKKTITTTHGRGLTTHLAPTHHCPPPPPPSIIATTLRPGHSNHTATHPRTIHYLFRSPFVLLSLLANPPTRFGFLPVLPNPPAQSGQKRLGLPHRRARGVRDSLRRFRQEKRRRIDHHRYLHRRNQRQRGFEFNG